MMTFILVIHSIACILLVLTVLMQAGRGGGLTESFSSAENVFGAQTSAFMVKATGILATIFFITSLTLAFFSARQERSLMDTQNAAPIVKTSEQKKVVSEAVNEVEKAEASADAQMPKVEIPPAVTEAVDQATAVVTNTQK